MIKNDKATQLIGMLPALQQEWENMNSGEMAEYEKTLNDTANRAIKMLKDFIEDGTMSLDIQTAVGAAAVLTKAQKDLMDSKRKLIETTMKGVVLMKALADEPKRDSVLDAYADRFQITDQTQKEGNDSSIFGMIATEQNKEEVTDESELESSPDSNSHRRGRPRKEG